MRKSKLELYQDVICTLEKKALTLDSLAFECGASCVLLQDKLAFLVNHDVVSIEVSRDNRVFYVLTRRGLAISKTLRIAKRLEKLQIPNAAEKFVTLPAFPEAEKTNRPT
jgi:predicted transcriptional regulator